MCYDIYNFLHHIVSKIPISTYYKLITHDKDSPHIYYELETNMLYKYLVDNNILERNKNILEIGCGGGVFYKEYKTYLKGLNNQYFCIDIEEKPLIQAKKVANYVNFKCLDIHDYPIDELGKHDIILMVQTYICVPNINNVIKKYFKQNPNGKIIIINTIIPECLTGISNILRDVIAKGIYNINWGKALTLNYMIEFSNQIKRHLTYDIIGQSSLSGHDEYIMILQ
jgi:2-polyprenyl-3-methyl-5-hydroxy-6-metoxy-1,4-benzoquinol methylase